MPKHYRLSPIAIQLAEGAEKAPEKIQVIRTGQFHHPTYGKFEITKNHLLAFKANFDARVRGVDIALDYGHNSEGEAAAWFKSIELSDDGQELWAVPEWTPDGAASVLAKKFRYVSADFNFDYQDNETLKKHGPTLLGAGLTNRPVVKGQAPVIELTEGRELEVDPKDKMIEELKAKIAELEAKLGGGVAAAAQMGDMKKELEEKDKALSEMKAKVAALESDKETAAKKAQFDTKLSEGVVVEAQRAAFMSGDMTKFMELAQPVKLSDKGHGVTPPPAPAKAKDAADEVIELAEKAVAEKRAPDVVAGISLVLSENAELAKRYAEM